MRTRSPLPALATWAVLCLAAQPAGAIVLPSGFIAENATTTPFDTPTMFAFLPGGRMLVAEKKGRVWAVVNRVRADTALWEGRAEVLNKDDRGLLGLAVDPNYVTNHYIYLLYTVDPDSNGVDDNDDAFGRLTRYTVSFADSNTVDYASRKVLMGATWPEGPVSDSPSHTEGDLQWGADGSLFVSIGDGAEYSFADAGGHDSDLFVPGQTSPVENIGAFRSQYIGSLAGKILRINPSDGLGYPDNPFWNGDAGSVQSRIWCYGFRNPFRFTVRPGSGSPVGTDHRPGTLFIGDVGWDTWEEQNIARRGGLNFGWPCYEGVLVQPAYQAAHPIHHNCDSLGLGDNTGILTPPTIYYPHGVAASTPPGLFGSTAVGGVFYTGHIYPTGYRNRYFFTDYVQGWIKYAEVNGNDEVVSVSDFAEFASGPVDVEVDPVSGDLYYVAIYTGYVRRIRWTGPIDGNSPPVAVASGTPSWGSVPLRVSFSSAGSQDPDLDRLSFSWDFGDGSGSQLENPTHTYTQSGSFAAVLSVEDGAGGLARDTVWVTAVGGAGPFPTTPVLDRFDRSDGPLGPSWSGDISGAVVQANAAMWTCCDVRAIWNGGAFAGDQEAACTVGVTKFAAEGLLLKVQQDDWRSGHIEVRYDAPANRVAVSTYDPVAGFVERGTFPVAFAGGDRMGARAWSDGSVELYRNEAPIGACSVGDWPYAGLPGSIGFVMRAPAPGSIDDFGGGSIVQDKAPTATIASPADRSFCIEGETLTLQALARDPDQSSLTLNYDWRVDLHHGTHVHPATYVAAGALASYVIPGHDDNNGIWYEIMLHVTDAFGLADTARVAVFPEVDLRPGPVSVNPVLPMATLPAEYRFAIYNDGRMIAPTSHWCLVGDGVQLAAGDTLIPGRDSVAISVMPTPGLLSPGEHTLRLVVDTLNVVVETDETNNSITRPLTVGTLFPRRVLPLADLPQTLALSHAYPSPAQGRVSLTLALPAEAHVEFSVHDLQGRRVWGEPPRTIEAGRAELAWNGDTDGGGLAPPGIYLARVTIGGTVLVRPIARLR